MYYFLSETDNKRFWVFKTQKDKQKKKEIS